MLGKREQMGLEFVQRHGRVHRGAVVQDVQVAVPKIDDPLAAAILYICIPNIPLFRDGPIEDWGSGWHFGDLQRNSVLDQRQGLPDAIAGDAAADRIELCREAVQFPAESLPSPSGRVPLGCAWHFFEIRICPVPFGNHFDFVRPNNLKCRIVPTHSPGQLRMVELRHLIENLGLVL